MKTLFSAIAFFIALVSAHANAKTLYSVNFDTPNIPFQQQYNRVFGAPQVVGPIGDFTSNSLAFNCSSKQGNSNDSLRSKVKYDQISFRIDDDKSIFRGLGKSLLILNFDLLTHRLIGSQSNFAVIFDTPTVRVIHFRNDGRVMISGSKNTGRAPFAEFVDDKGIHIEITFNIEQDKWEIKFDNKLVHSGTIKGETLRTVRFSHGEVNQCDATATTYIDNILITAPSID